MKTSLYRYFTEGGSLLYVGISHNPFLREYQHSRFGLDAAIGIDPAAIDEGKE